ncbi:hypothetical protein HC864_03645 [Candidatus Gracilibacteria bacterium]|nr:hypothetical protein [Candidatus Gracilibacteria bacterium]
MSKLKKALDYSRELSEPQKLVLAVLLSVILILIVVFSLTFLNNLIMG